MSLEQTNTNSSKIPFKVSARTARLIGRENIATSKGAIIELIKNGYDADSPICIVYFDNKFSTIQDSISKDYYQELISLGLSEEYLKSFYQIYEEEYQFNEGTTEEEKKKFKNVIAKFSTLYIIDFGEGMTQNIIRNHWMTIGTDNKATNVFTKSGRVKAGAKGIGRFALDKLGSNCEMTTIFNPKNHEKDTNIEGKETDYSGYKWIVNWEDFEGEFKTIDSVNAELIGINSTSIKNEIQNAIPQLDLSEIPIDYNEFWHGTMLKISNLRDNWEDYFIEQVYSDLEVLVPPKETGGFGIYLFSSLKPKEYGEVLGSICDDYDYKLVAKADEQQNVHITIFRNEYDVELMPKDLFNREEFTKSPFSKKEFSNGYWETNKSFSQLIKGFKDTDEDNVFDNIGVFEFSFYFLKRTYNTPDANRFFYRKFQSNVRKDWLNKFGGIKLFRDNFRVRPYGEIKDVAFDWLGLGNRKSVSPAGIAKEDGGYRVEPDNIAGAIKISRLTNVDFEDKSSREGLQDSKTFQVFKRLVISIISIFEKDRAAIARELKAYDDIKFGPERDRKKAAALAKRILAASRKKKEEQQQQSEQTENKNNSTKQNNNGSEEQSQDDAEKEILASEIELKDEEIENLKKEQKVLRALASSGIVLASFSHDLSKLNDVLSSRTEKLKNLISHEIKEDDFKKVEPRKNPFVQIEKIKKQDLKLQNWLKFSLSATRKDKRKRRQLFLKPYFEDFKNDWETVLKNRGIKLDTSLVTRISLRVFEIDIDSIFNNLLVNSIEAFRLLKEDRVREIKVVTTEDDRELTIDYYDNGAGISKDIEDPNEIFESLFTTKINPHTGDEIGTGLGMWIIKKIVLENDGVVKLLFPETGFGIRFTFPVKYKRK